MRPIDADDLIKAFEALGLMSGQYAESFTNLSGNRSIEIECAEGYINNAKTIDSAPVLHAHWYFDPDKSIGCGITVGGMFCSNCGGDCPTGSHPYRDFKYCPYCGAKMDKTEVTK